MGTHPLLQAARELTPLMQEHRAEGERLGRPVEAVHSAVSEAGLYRAISPIEVDGFEIGLPDQVRVCEQLGYADPNMAWCIGNSWGSGFLAGRMSQEAMKQVFADKDAFFGFGFAPGGRAISVREGYRFEGRWPVVSGSHLASWFALTGIVQDADGPALIDGRPNIRTFLVPAGSVEVLDTWSDVIGLRGSSSNAVMVHEAFVPEGLAVGLFDAPRIDRPVFRLPLMVAQLDLAAILTGIARAAVDAVIAQASGRVSVATGQAWRDWPGVQHTLATEMATVRAATAGLVDVAEECWEVHCDAGAMGPELRAMAYAMTDHATHTARQAVSRLYTAGSIDALHGGHRLEQALRDVHALSVNWERFRQLHFDAARVRLGLDPLLPSF
jgi:alkylation response protein AidB-like acyl-CoA dehydrogenase